MGEIVFKIVEMLIEKSIGGLGFFFSFHADWWPGISQSNWMALGMAIFTWHMGTQPDSWNSRVEFGFLK